MSSKDSDKSAQTSPGVDYFGLNLAGHEICPANKSQIINNCEYMYTLCLIQLSMKISLLINMKMAGIVGIFIFISRENFMLSCDENFFANKYENVNYCWHFHNY